MKKRQDRHLRLVADGDHDPSGSDLATGSTGTETVVDVRVTDASGFRWSAIATPVSDLRRLATDVLVGEGVESGSLDLHMVTTSFITELNRNFMGNDAPTDVLAFPLDGPDVVAGLAGGLGLGTGGFDHEVGDPEASDVIEGRFGSQPPVHLGDVLVCPAVAAAQAADHAGSTEAELALLVVHGVLHILGHDHVEPGETTRMQDRERYYLAERGYRHPVDGR